MSGQKTSDLRVVRIMCGLGNQMFQYAFARAMGDDVMIYKDGFQKGKLRSFQLDNFDIQAPCASRRLFNKMNRKSKLPKFICRLIGREYQKSYRVYEDVPNVYQPDLMHRTGLFWGYYQSPRYFEHIRPQLLREFSLKTPMDAANQEMLNKIKRTPNAVSLHVRRGDYLKCQDSFYLCDLDYYAAAMEYIAARVENPHFFLFSDDIEWVMNNLKTKFPCTPVAINSGDTGYFDIELMKHCRHNIIANSTFSWWGAWLNPNPDKIVIAPQKWARPPVHPEWNIYPDGWVVL